MEGLAFRGNDESEHSSNHGNFLELLQFLADHNEDVKAVTLKNAPENHKLTSLDIQKDIVNACATETIKAIIEDVGTSLFSILIDESRDVSTKEQMAIVLRYVDKNGHVVERFIGIEHVTSTIALSLKETIDEVFSRHKLSMSRLHGQGYDGAINMQASSKRYDLLREKQSIAVIEALNSADSFSAFDNQKLLRLVQFYPKDFSMNELVILKIQLETYIVDMRSSIEFSVATATVERAFSAMKILKNRLRNRMGDQWMNDNMVIFIEIEIFDGIGNDVVMQRFQNMKTC
nr:zinc finger MYM-type protein 1-like [Malus domestica]